MLAELTQRQEEYRGMLQHFRETEDRSYTDGLSDQATNGLNEDQLIAVACVQFEIRQDQDEDAEPAPIDLTNASEVIDHLETLGWTICQKNA